jgi:hypothetical protein
VPIIKEKILKTHTFTTTYLHPTLHPKSLKGNATFDAPVLSFWNNIIQGFGPQYPSYYNRHASIQEDDLEAVVQIAKSPK